VIKVKGKEEPLPLYRILWKDVDAKEMLSETKTIFPKA
jgi:hypothetical protein